MMEFRRDDERMKQAPSKPHVRVQEETNQGLRDGEDAAKLR